MSRPLQRLIGGMCGGHKVNAGDVKLAEALCYKQRGNAGYQKGCIVKWGCFLVVSSLHLVPGKRVPCVSEEGMVGR